MGVEGLLSEGARAGLAFEPPGSWVPRLPPGCVRLSAGYPFPESVPATELAEAARAVVAEEGAWPFQYLGSGAFSRLSGHLRARLEARGVLGDEDDLLVTAGSCQALDLVGRALLDRDSLVAVEGPTYMEALEVFRNFTPRLQTLPADEEGLDVEAFAADLARKRATGLARPKLVYTIPSHHNPTGRTLSLGRRQRLVALAEEHDFVVLEDDAYGELAFGEPPVPLKAMDRAGRVLHTGSLSKVVAPGLRVGWLAGHPALVRAAGLFKKDLDHPFAWAVAARYLETIDLEARLRGLRTEYRRRRDAMLEALGSHMPPSVRWTKPEGGFFVWLDTPGLDTGELLGRAMGAGVAYLPGRHFYFGDNSEGQTRGLENLRLSYCFVPEDDMRRGVALLGRVLTEAQP